VNPNCENSNRNGDCIERNSRHLCDVCFDLLTPAEMDSRDVCFIVSDYARKAQRQLAALKTTPLHCLALRPNEDRSCLQRELVALCAFCICSMSEGELIAYATAIVQKRREITEYWEAEEEAKEYAAELGVNLCDCCPNIDEWETMVNYATFHTSKPCFIHPDEMELAA